MQLEKLRLKGFVGIKKGLGLDEIEIDFRDLRGLVAISGDNGRGKTTILESMHPYRCFFSRKGALKHHVFLRDSEKELEFIFGGHHYRTLVKIDAQSDRSEAFIWEDGNSLTTGKVTEYDKALERIIGDAEVFRNAVLSAQNAERLSDMTTGEIKDLLVKFLHLDKLDRYTKTAKQAAKILTQKAEQAEFQVNSAQLVVNSFDEIKISMEEKEMGLEMSEAKKKSLELSLKNTDETIEGLKARIAQAEVNQERIADMVEQLKGLEAGLDECRESAAEDRESNREEVRQVDHDIKNCESVTIHKDKIESSVERETEIHQKIQNISEKSEEAREKLSLIEQKLSEQGLVAERCAGKLNQLKEDTSIKMMESELQNLDLRAKAKMQKVKDLPNDPELIEIGKKKGEQAAHIATLRSRIVERPMDDPDVASAKYNLDRCKEQMEALDKRDPSCTSTTCAFIVNAIRAKESLPEAEAGYNAAVQALEDRNAGLQKTIDQAEVDLDAMTDAESKRLCEIREIDAALTKEVEGIESQIYDTNLKMEERKTAIQAEIKKAQDELSSTEREIDGLTRDRMRIKDELEAGKVFIRALSDQLEEVKSWAEMRPNLQVKLEQVAELQAKKEKLVEKGVKDQSHWKDKQDTLNRQINDLTKKIQGLQSNEDLNGQLQNAIGFKDKCRSDLETVQKSIVELGNQIYGLKSKLKDRDSAVDKLTQARQRLADIRKEISDWEYLVTACGKNGLQALEIDAVTPTMISYTNEMLSNTYGAQHTINFRTQDEESGKEKLDILVIDEAGDEALLENKSGGQQVWIHKALRLAMTLINQEKADVSFQEIYCDEEDGALSAEKAVQFVQMYRTILSMTDMDRCFFISHKAEAINMADHIIEVGDGVVAVQ